MGEFGTAFKGLQHHILTLDPADNQLHALAAQEGLEGLGIAVFRVGCHQVLQVGLDKLELAVAKQGKILVEILHQIHRETKALAAQCQEPVLHVAVQRHIIFLCDLEDQPVTKFLIRGHEVDELREKFIIRHGIFRHVAEEAQIGAPLAHTPHKLDQVVDRADQALAFRHFHILARQDNTPFVVTHAAETFIMHRATRR